MVFSQYHQCRIISVSSTFNNRDFLVVHVNNLLGIFHNWCGIRCKVEISFSSNSNTKGLLFRAAINLSGSFLRSQQSRKLQQLVAKPNEQIRQFCSSVFSNVINQITQYFCIRITFEYVSFVSNSCLIES